MQKDMFLKIKEIRKNHKKLNFSEYIIIVLFNSFCYIIFFFYIKRCVECVLCKLGFIIIAI